MKLRFSHVRLSLILNSAVKASIGSHQYHIPTEQDKIYKKLIFSIIALTYILELNLSCYSKLVNISIGRYQSLI